MAFYAKAMDDGEETHTVIPVSREVAQLTATLQAKGFEAFLVGGCVRDALLRKAPKDYDVATDALPETVEAIFSNRRVIRTGIAHGTVTVIIDNIPIEVTTYRIEGEYRDNRRPSHVAFTDSILHDLSRRDFTINAMAYSEADGLKDPFGGQADLNAGILRAVGDPRRRFAEDALRIVRALRPSSDLPSRSRRQRPCMPTGITWVASRLSGSATNFCACCVASMSATS